MSDLIEGHPGVVDDPYSYPVIGAAIEVHRRLGPGFLEVVYARALRSELTARGLPWAAEVRVPIIYRGAIIGNHRLDLVVGGDLVVELKSAAKIDAVHFAQVRSYLAAAGLRVGLLLNFDQTRVTIRRIVDQHHKDRLRGLGVSAPAVASTTAPSPSPTTPS